MTLLYTGNWYDVLLHWMTKRQFYLLSHIITVKNPPKNDNFQKKSPIPRGFECQILRPHTPPRSGVPGYDGAPPWGWYL